MKFTKIPESTFSQIQLNAGVLLKSFDPSSATVNDTDIIGATSGGNTFEATPTYTDYGEDIDNCPTNMKELKKLDSWEVKLSGSMITVNADNVKMLIGPADSEGDKITPRNDIDVTKDFLEELWWVGDYSDKNGEKNGGFIAIKLINALSTGGFKVTSQNKGKGTFDYEFTGHYSMDDQDKVPFEVYVHAGTEEGA